MNNKKKIKTTCELAMAIRKTGWPTTGEEMAVHNKYTQALKRMEEEKAKYQAAKKRN